MSISPTNNNNNNKKEEEEEEEKAKIWLVGRSRSRE